MKKIITVLTAFGIMLSSAAVLPERDTSDAPVGIIKAQAKEKSVTDYKYEITPLLSPFNEYFFVKTDNPDPHSFSFADKSSKYSNKSLIELNEDTFYDEVYLYADVKYENKDTGRVNGGYIFKSGNTDGGEIVLQKREHYFIGEDTYEDTKIRLKLPALIDSTDYLIKTYANKSGFFDNMDAVQSGFEDICLYSGSFIRGTLKKADNYWSLSTSPHKDQTFYLQSPYIREDNEPLFASAIYPFRYDSLGFPSVMAEVSQRLDGKSSYKWDGYEHYTINVTYNGETRSYGGQGEGEGQAILKNNITQYFTFGSNGTKITLQGTRELLEKYSALNIKSDIPENDKLTWESVCNTVGEGAWVKLIGLDSIFGSSSEAYTYLYKTNDGTAHYTDPASSAGSEIYWGGDLGYYSNTWVDGRYIDAWETFVRGAKFSDHPTANIMLMNYKLPQIKYHTDWEYDYENYEYTPNYVIDEIKIKEKRALFFYNSQLDCWTAGYGSFDDDCCEYYTISELCDKGLIDKKYLDMISLTKDEVLALNVDKNTDNVPTDGFIFDGTATPGTAYHITPLSDNRISVTLSASSYSYTGGEIKPLPTVSFSDKKLKSGIDYTVSYKNNTKVGTATVTITGKGYYTGSVSKSFKISSTPISKATVTGLSSKGYTGKAITQNPTVKVGSRTLKKGTDYTLSFKNNKAIGTATVTITGKGGFKGSVKKTFKITKASIAKAKVTGISKRYKYTGKAIKPTVKTVKLDNVTLKKGRDYTVSYKNNKKAGTATVMITGKGNYKGTVKKTFKILSAQDYKMWQYTKQVVTLVNKERTSRGLKELKLNETLYDKAMIRSKELLKTFSHTRPNGKSCFTVLNGISYSAAGENIAAGQRTPKEVVNAWMNSPGHRANILSKDFTEIGVGLVYNSKDIYGYYWTQVFIG